MRSFWILPFVLAACATEPTRRTYNNKENTPPVKAKSEKSASANQSSALKEAQSYYSQGNFDKTLSTLAPINEKLMSKSEQAEFWNLKGLTRLATQKPDFAELCFRRAITANQNPEFAGYYQYNLATSLANQGKSIEANEALNQIDLQTLDAADQKKVTALREKLGSHTTDLATAPETLAAPTTTPQPTAAPVTEATPLLETYSGAVNPNRIGLLLPLSGRYEAFGKKVQRAIELAFQHSTVPHAKDAELIPIDSGDTAASSEAALKKLVEENQVIAVIGPLLSKGMDSLSQKAEYYQVPLISIAQVQGSVSNHLFSCSISTQDQASKMAEYAINVRGFKRFAILAPSNKAGSEMAHRFWDEVQARSGEVKSFELYDPDITDFREPVDKALGLHYTELRAKELREMADKRKELEITKKTMKTAQYFALPPIIDFDAVFIADEAKTVGQIIPTFTFRDAKNLNFLGITSWNSSQLLSRAQDQAEGAVFPVAFNTLSPPTETKAFYDLYSSTYSSYPGELDAIAFDAATMAIQAYSDHPSDRDSFSKKLEGLNSIQAATGSISMKDHRCSRNLALYQIKKNQFEAVSVDAASTPTAPAATNGTSNQ